MDSGQIRLSKGRDFFVVRAPHELFNDLMGFVPRGQPPVRTLVLDLQRREPEVRALRIDGSPTPVMAFPRAHQALVRILTGSGRERNDTVEVLLPRRTFDQLADRQGAARIKRLDLETGIASDDTVLRHLGACLEHTLSAATPATMAALDQLAESITVHIAQRYGALQPARAPQSGGLNAWQLRLALSMIDQCLDGAVSLDDLARKCGLSVSHFSRAFRRSMGLAPHRWLTQRRIEVAKDLMLSEPMPLAQVAIACGFADQSHFTRTFATLNGLTPARWRINQEREFALG